MTHTLGIEFGSTRIKAVLIDEAFRPVASGDYTWKRDLRDGVWTYDLEEAWNGLRTALRALGEVSVDAMGISAMMHGYLAFDRDWNLLVPFRTWQNTSTGPAATELTELFGFNIPQRWSIAHLWHAIRTGEAHVGKLAHITTLAGYFHYMLTGVNAVGIGEASGMFPIDSETLDYDRGMMEKFDRLIADQPFTLRELLPQVLPAGVPAGKLTTAGAARLDGLLPEGIVFAPAEGDAGTGMTATNAVGPRTGNVSAGTSIFSMVVLEHPLQKVYPEIDLVTTPTGRPVAMVHCNNCTNDMNAWAGVLVVNYLAGEGVTHLDEGRPLVLRRPDSRFTLANFLRAQLYSTMATLKIGMDLLASEQVAIDSLTGHGGLFKTPGVGQKYMAAACGAPVTVMESAGEGGPYGMALLAAFVLQGGGETLEDFLAKHVFADAVRTTLQPDPADVEGFRTFLNQYKACLRVEQAATENL